MRSNYIVTYDICHPKRLRKVFKVCKGYGIHLQLSVFECDLTPAERTEFEGKLNQIIKASEDQVLFVSLGPSHLRGERSIQALGLQYNRFDQPCYVA
ncbi:MAG: CRISPR-associated endonuclease Cas2 [Opitutales bacterium]